MNDEQLRIRANEARQLLENNLLKDAFLAVGDYIESQAMTCAPDDKDRCARIIASKQLLAAVKRELYKHIDNGMFAETRIAEIEKRKRLTDFLR